MRDLAHQDIQVQVIRHDGKEEIKMTISSLDLVPGDQLILTPEMKLPADILLTKGDCIVNEGMLTGESTPIKKSNYSGHQ